MAKMNWSEYRAARRWHEEYLDWCVKNRVTDGIEYQSAKFALECIDYRYAHEMKEIASCNSKAAV